MKLLGRILAIASGIILLAAGVVCGWLYFYNADLPSIAELDRYNPAAASEIQTGDNSLTHVVPSELLGKYS